jgi:hypothetical protein
VTSVAREVHGDDGFLLDEYAEGLIEGLGEALDVELQVEVVQNLDWLE